MLYSFHSLPHLQLATCHPVHTEHLRAGGTGVDEFRGNGAILPGGAPRREWAGAGDLCGSAEALFFMERRFQKAPSFRS